MFGSITVRLLTRWLDRFPNPFNLTGEVIGSGPARGNWVVVFPRGKILSQWHAYRIGARGQVNPGGTGIHPAQAYMTAPVRRDRNGKILRGPSGGM